MSSNEFARETKSGGIILKMKDIKNDRQIGTKLK